MPAKLKKNLAKNELDNLFTTLDLVREQPAGWYTERNRFVKIENTLAMKSNPRMFSNSSAYFPKSKAFFPISEALIFRFGRMTSISSTDLFRNRKLCIQF